MAANQAVSRGNAKGDSTHRQISYETVFQAVADHYKQDLREFFTRANFYLAVHAALLTAIGIRDAPDTQLDYAVTIIIILAGVVLSCVWGVVSYGSVFWIRQWREEIQRLSKAHSPTDSYDKVEDDWKTHPYRSPEEITKFLPWFFGIVWVALAVALWVMSSNLY